MNINSQLTLELRREYAWSQDELALAAGLNSRTIQRIEKTGQCSLQSMKALASVFDLSLQDLQLKEGSVMHQFEYKTLEILNPQGFLAGIKKAKGPDFVSLLNREGQEGWSLVQILTPDLAQGMWTGQTGSYLAIMRRARVLA